METKQKIVAKDHDLGNLISQDQNGKILARLAMHNVDDSLKIEAYNEYFDKSKKLYDILISENKVNYNKKMENFEIERMAFKLADIYLRREEFYNNGK